MLRIVNVQDLLLIEMADDEQRSLLRVADHQGQILPEGSTAQAVQTLPDGFPTRAAKPSELWAQLRTLALAHAGRHPEGLRQAELLDAQQDPRSAAILAGLLVDAGQATRAAALPALDEGTAVYLLHVAANDAPLATMASGGGPRAALAADALADRRLGNGDWAAGAPGPGGHRARARRTVAGGGQAGFRPHPGRAPGPGTVAARSLGGTVPAQWSRQRPRLLGATRHPVARPQRARLVDWQLRGTEAHRALEAYGAALANMDPRGPATAALKEADRLYNQLIDQNAGEFDPYNQLLSGSRAARQIRAAGKAIRAARGSP